MSQILNMFGGILAKESFEEDGSLLGKLFTGVEAAT